MMDYLLFFGAISGVCIAVATLAVKRYGLGRRGRKAAADNALREMYGLYWTEVRALSQRRMLNAASDEEWLADIRVRASASRQRDLRRQCAADTRQVAIEPGPASRIAVLGLILDHRRKKLESKSAAALTQARQEMYRALLTRWAAEPDHAASYRELIIADSFHLAVERDDRSPREDPATAALIGRMRQAARLQAYIEAETRCGSLKHHRLPRWMRWVPTLIAGLDFCLLLYSFAAIVRLRWADPQLSRLILMLVLAGVVTALSFGCSSLAGHMMRACKSHAGTVSLGALDTITKSVFGVAAASIVGISALIFIQIRAGILYAIGANSTTVALLAALALAILVGSVNFLAIAVYALDGSDDLVALARSPVAVSVHLESNRTWRREALFHWAPRIGGTIAVLGALATGLYFLHPAAVIFTIAPIAVAFYRIYIVLRPPLWRENQSWTAESSTTARPARSWPGFMTARGSPLQPDDADRA